MRKDWRGGDESLLKNGTIVGSAYKTSYSRAGYRLMMIDWCIFILLSRESDGALCFGRIRTRLGVDHFPSFPVGVLTSSHVNLLLVRSHQAEIIIVKRLIQGRNNVTRVRVELMILRSESP